MKKLVSRLISVLCVFAILVCHFAGCGKNPEDETAANVPDTTPQVTVDPVLEKIEDYDDSWVDELSGKSKDPDENVETEYDGGSIAIVGVTDTVLPDPFCFESSNDTTVAELILTPLLEKERSGYIFQNGVDGETFDYNDTEYTYNGIASVTVEGNTLKFTLRDDIFFSDGVNLTADDVIFTMYVLADPAYDGTASFGKLPIEGLTEYRGNMQQKWKAILCDLAASETGGGYTAEDSSAFSEAFNEAGIIFTKEIVHGCVERFADEYVTDIMGVTVEELMENEGLQIAFSQYFWDYSTGYGEDGLWYDVSGKSYDLIESYPTYEDYWKLILDNHGYDISNDGINYEKIGEQSFEEILISVIHQKCPQLLVSTDDENAADNISGIKKTGMYSFDVTFTELLPGHLNSFCFYVAPLHHYGSREAYKYSENKFGFEKGNLSAFRHENDEVLGSGAYRYESAAENGDITLKRNKLYYKGCPNVETLIVTRDKEKADIYYKTYEGECAYTGAYKEVETNTYVIIGIDAEHVCVGGNKFADASVSLRNAFTTVFEAFRETAVAQWENGGIESAADDSSWSNDFKAVERNTKMSAIALLKDAGYIWDDEHEVFTEAPEGASMSYEVKLYGYDAAYIVLTHAKNLFAEIGITLEISEQSTRESLENIIEAGEAQIWVMQVDDFSLEYIFESLHSEGGKTLFSISTKELDESIEWADSQFDNDTSVEGYEEILSDILELGVMVPVYKRIDAVIYSERVVPESIADDITASWSWVKEVHLLEIKAIMTPVSE